MPQLRGQQVTHQMWGSDDRAACPAGAAASVTAAAAKPAVVNRRI
ncbi:MAG TPA: hypothetical protein VIM22_10985 [Solirubrobacteraceae bacterium]